MKKIILPVVVFGAAVVAAGGIKYTGDQAHAAMVNMTEQVNAMPGYQGLIKAELKSSPGFMESRYTLDLVIEDPNLVEFLNIERIPFDVKVNNGFLAAHYDTRLAPGELLAKIKATQANPNLPPLHFTADATFNPASQQLVVDQVFRSDAFSIREAGNEFRLGAFESSGTLDGTRFTGQGKMGDTVITENGAQLMKMSGLTVDQSGEMLPGTSYLQGLLASFDIDMSVQELWMNNAAAQKVVKLNDIGIQMSQAAKAERTLLDLAYSMGAVGVESQYEEPVSLNSARLDMTFDFDSVAYRAFIKQMNELPPAQRQNPFVMMGAVTGLTAKGIRLNLGAFDVQTDKGGMQAGGDLQMAGFDVMQGMQDPNALLQKLDGNFNFSVDETLLQALPDQNPRRELDALAAQGLMKKEGGKVSTEVSVKQGRISVNGIPMT